MLRATRTARWPLFLVVAVVVFGGLVIATTFSWLLGGIAYGWWDPSHLSTTPDTGVSFLEPVKIALTIAAGIGAAVALVVAYRKQRLAERQEPREQYIAAVKQMGDASPTVRLAGVYALANLADDHPALAQQCIDVLCGHLRIPWEPPSPDHPTASRTVQQQGPGLDATTVWTHPATHGEQQVRETILRVIAGRVCGPPDEGLPGPWSHLHYDFTDAVLPAGDFNQAMFTHHVLFTGATFLTAACFTLTTFEGDADFQRARFTRGATFMYGQFRSAHFEGAVFDADADFTLTKFTVKAWFKDTRFNGQAYFSEGDSPTRFDGTPINGAVELRRPPAGSEVEPAGEHGQPPLGQP